MNDTNNKLELTKEQIGEALKTKAYTKLKVLFKVLESADIGEALEEEELNLCSVAFRLIPKVRRAEIFTYLSVDKQKDLLYELSEDLVIFILNDMDPVDRTKLLEEVDEGDRARFLLKLDPKEKSMAATLLSYPESSVGRLMTPEFLAVDKDMTVSQAIDYIRWNASRFPEDLIQHVFVVDEAKKYIGDLSLGKLFVTDSSEYIKDIVGPTYVVLSAYDDETAAVDCFRKYDRNFYPVVKDNELVGVVTADDVFDVAEEDATEDIQQFGGSSAIEDSYFDTPIFTLIKKRIFWLVFLFFGGIWSGEVLEDFNIAIKRYTYLVFFLPLIVAAGGNCGSQSASLIIRGFAIKDITLRDYKKVLLRELLAGLGLGIPLAILGFFTVRFYWEHSTIVAVAVSLSLIGVVAFGGIIGAMLPFIMKVIRFDPAVSSSPLIASLVDVCGIMIFFSIAVFLLDKFQ